MSKKAAAEFVEMAAENPMVKERVRAKGGSLSDERLANAVAVGKEEGFEFTIEELREVMASAEGAEGELMDAELDAVVGGAASGYKYWLGKALSLLNGGGGGDSGGSNAVAGVRG